MDKYDKMAKLAEEFLKLYHSKDSESKSKKRRNDYKGERKLYPARFTAKERQALDRLSKKLDLSINDTIIASIKLMLKEHKMRIS